MVFYDIDSITDVLSGHRVIIYYIEGDVKSKLKLCRCVESLMEMLEKKNDDLIIFKVCQNTHQFNQFKELYKPDITSPIALFAINMEGIPLICEQIDEEGNVSEAVDSICTYCKLNAVSKSEITKVIDCETEKLPAVKTNSEIFTNGLRHRGDQEASKSSLSENDLPVLDLGPGSKKDSEEALQAIYTVLQIRLPDGTKRTQEFRKNALLQEVCDFIRTKFNLRDFDLKTYNRHIFSAGDYESSLIDLDLTPNGVVIVVYKNIGAFNNNNSISKMIHSAFWIVFTRTTSVFQYVQGLVYAFWNSFFSSESRRTGDTRDQTRRNNSGGQRSSSNGVKRSTGTSRFGNVHTLRRNDDSDDENNRYNGNSTQQK